MQHYIFDNKHNYHTATASGIDASAKYTLTSLFVRRSGGAPDTTTLRSPYGKEGTIHWKNREIEIYGVKHLIDDLRQEDTGPGSLFAHRWALDEKQWRSKYVLESKSWQVWTLNDNKPADTVAVEFKPYLSKTFGKSEAATIGVSIPDAESVFVILFLIYSQVTERPRISLAEKFSHAVATAIAYS